MDGIHRRTLIKAGVVGTVALCSPAAFAEHVEKKMREPGGPEITPFLMFEGTAEQAMNFYVALFERSEVLTVKRYGPGEQGKEGSVQLATFSLNGRKLMCIDSPGKHSFTFTPSISLYVSCPDEEKITRYFNKLSEGGQVLMPLDEYPFSKRFGWVQDKFGVSWQLNAS